MVDPAEVAADEEAAGFEGNAVDKCPLLAREEGP